MSVNVTRRKFLGGAAAAGTATLLPSTASAAVKKSAATADTAKKAVATDTANANLTKAAVAKVKWKAEPFSMTDVRLLPSQWTDMMELNRSFLYSLPNDRLAHNFRVTASIPSDAAPLGGWEAPDCELRGHYVGHYLSACAFQYASTGDDVIKAKVTDLVAILATTQQKDGYLGAYPATWYDKLRATYPRQNPPIHIWAPFYTYHKIMAGLVDVYEHTGNPQALDMAEKMADWADTYSKTYTPENWQGILLVEHGGMNEVSFNLYAITGKEKYKDLAYRFEHKKIFDPLADNKDILGGNHANTNIPKIIGAVRGYELTGDERYNAIANNFWTMVSDHHSYCTGGTSNGEGWKAPDAIASELGPAAEECCCSYNMMKLTRHLFGQKQDAKYFDYYERMLVNVRHGTQDRNGMLMYYVSLKPGMYKTFGTPFDAFWCCTGTGSEEYAKLNDSIYFHNDDSVFVNLYVPSKLNWKERGLQIRQTSKFPEEERITFTIDAAPSQPVALQFRIPYWATKDVALKINDAEQSVTAIPSSYLKVEQAWKVGDVITLDLPLQLHINTAPDDKKVQAAMYGPLVLAVRMGTEGLTTGMIYGGSGPRGFDSGYDMPSVDTQRPARRRPGNNPTAASATNAVPESTGSDNGVWFEQIDGTREYPLQFQTKGRGPLHTLVPLAKITDERYTVYVRNDGIA